MIVALPLVIGALTFAAVAVLGERRSVAATGRRIAAYTAPRRVALVEPEREQLRTLVRRPLDLSETVLRRLPLWRRLERLVERADLSLRPVELVWAAAGGALAVVALLTLLGSGLGISIVAAVGLLLGLRVALARRVAKRRDAFDEQLPELLHALGSALRAGHGLTQAMQAAAADMPEPASKELTRVLAETRLGRPLDDALTDFGSRIDSRALDFVLDAIILQRQVGGSLAGIFTIVGDAVRQRHQFALKLRALTAMGRASALVLAALPAVLAGALSLLNHGYLSPLLHSSAGRTMLIVSIVLLGVGCVWLRRIVAVRG